MCRVSMRNVRSCGLFETRQKRYRLRRRGRHWREVRQESEKAGAELASICIKVIKSRLPISKNNKGTRNGVNKSLVGDGESSPIQHRLPGESGTQAKLEEV